MAANAELPSKFVRMKQCRRTAERCRVTIAAMEAESGHSPEPLLAFRWAQIEFGSVGEVLPTCALWERYRLPPFEAAASA